MLQFKKWISGITAGVVLLSGMAFSGVEGALTEVVSGMPEMTASAEEISVPVGTGTTTLTYDYLSSGTIEITGCDITTEGELEIPAEIDGVAVTVIRDYAFNGCESLTSIKIPDTVTSIGQWAFGSCSNLAAVIIPDSVRSIEENAFSGCTALSSVTIGTGVTNIGGFAFSATPWLTERQNEDPLVVVNHILIDATTSKSEVVEIPDGVTKIGEYAFSQCDNLIHITIPDSVTSIKSWAFYSCDNLTTITIGKGVESIESYAFYSCSNLTDVYYNSSEEEWNEIEIGDIYNECLTDATIHFASQSGTSVATATTITDVESTATTTTTTTAATSQTTTVAKTADLDGDDAITISDAFFCLTAYANSAAGNDDGLTEAQREAADVDGDGNITIMDASYILQFYAQTAAGNSPTWTEILSA